MTLPERRLDVLGSHPAHALRVLDSQPENSILNLAVSHASSTIGMLTRINFSVNRHRTAVVAMLEPDIGNEWMFFWRQLIFLGRNGYCLAGL